MSSGKDYDEFRNFVACSQLKPVHRSEMSQLFQPSSQIHSHRNSMNKAYSSTQQVSYNRDATSVSDQLDLKKIGSIVNRRTNKEKKGKKRSKHKVNRGFDVLKKLGKSGCSSGETLHYLLSTTEVLPLTKVQSKVQNGEEASHQDTTNNKTYQILNEVFSQNASSFEINNDILGKIVEALELFLQRIEIADICEVNQILKPIIGFSEVQINNFTFCIRFLYFWISEMSKTGRFSINVMFLNEKQTSALTKIFAFFERLTGADDNSATDCTDEQTKIRDGNICNLFNIEKNELENIFTPKDVERLRSIYIT